MNTMSQLYDEGPLSPPVDLQKNKSTSWEAGPSVGSPDQLDKLENLSLYSSQQVKIPAGDHRKVFQHPDQRRQFTSHVKVIQDDLEDVSNGKAVNVAQLVDELCPSTGPSAVLNEQEKLCDSAYTQKTIYDDDDNLISLGAKNKFLTKSKNAEEWQLGCSGRIIPGNRQTVKTFMNALEGYKYGINIATSRGIQDTENLVVIGHGNKATSIAVGSDCVKGVHLNKIQQFDTKHLCAVKSLGKGQYGKVYQYEDELNGKQWAIKSVVLDRKMNLHEAEVLALAATEAGSDNIIAAHAFYISNCALHFVMDVAGSNLESYMKNLFCVVDENVLRNVLKQCLKGLQFLNRHGYIHLDIKPQNISIDVNQQVKLLDLGSCSKIGEETENAGLTPKYVAKEVAEPYLHRWNGFEANPLMSPKADIYSLGCCLISLGRREHIWDKVLFTEYNRALEYIFSHEAELQCEIPLNYGKSYVNLMKQMTMYDPECRCGVEKALQHPFCQDPQPVIFKAGLGQEFGRVNFDPTNPGVSLQELQATCSSSIRTRPNHQPIIKHKIKVEHEPPKGCAYSMVKAEQEIFAPCQQAVKQYISQPSDCAVNAVPRNTSRPIIKIIMPQGGMTMEELKDVLAQYFQESDSVQMSQPTPDVPTTLTDLDSHPGIGPVPVEDNAMDTTSAVSPWDPAMTDPAPLNPIVPKFDEILTDKAKRDMYPGEEINLRATGASVVNSVVPEFDHLLTTNNDYTRPQHKVKRVGGKPPAPVVPDVVMSSASDYVDLRKPGDHIAKKTQRRPGKPYKRKNSKR